VNPIVRCAVPLAYKWVMAAVMGTCNVRTTGQEHVRALTEQSRSWLYCTWHNNAAMTVCRLRDRRMVMMASISDDGELIARAIEKFGNLPVRGSSSHGGGHAARDMVRAIRAGASGAMTPDGPRGPAYRCQVGALWIAALSGCPLVPYELEARRQWRTRSWDRHKIPKPFTTIFEHIGEPFYVDRDRLKGDEDAVRDEFESRMLANTQACRRAAGHDDALTGN